MGRTIKIPEPEKKPEPAQKPEVSPHILDLKEKPKTSEKKHADIIPPEGFQRITPKIKLKTKQPKKSEVVRMAAVAVAVVFVLNIGQTFFKIQKIKDETISAAYAGYEAMMEISPADFESTNAAFDTALYQFELAENAIWYLMEGPENKYTKAADGLIGAGSSLASAGQLFAAFAEEMKGVGEGILSESSEGKPSLTASLESLFDTCLYPAYEDLKRAEIYLEDVDPNLIPADYKSKFEIARTQMSDLLDFMEVMVVKFPAVLELLGHEHPQKYMILLENNSELRPGGGFIGSFLTLDINDGYIDNMEFHDIYDWDGPFNEYIAPPVEEIEYLTCCWGLRDANYSPDFAVSSEKTAWFFEHEGGPTVDHVMMVDLSFVSELIDIVGPIYSETLGGELTGENFELVLSYYVESKLHGYENPKGVLPEVIDSVKTELKKLDKPLELMELIVDGIKGKHLAAYSKDEEIQGFWQGLNLDAEVEEPSPNEDYLMVTVSGIGGNKTDKYILQNINHQTLISREGEVLNKITITRKHTYNENTELWQRATLSNFGFNEISEDVQKILGSGDNIAGIRVYVPSGTQLLSWSGDLEKDLETYYDEDLELNYFYAQVRTPADSSSEIEITYSIPAILDLDPVDDYFLFVDKQPGLSNTTFTKQIIAPNLTSHALYPTQLAQQEDSTYHYETALDSNLHLGGVFGR
ncbi:MAG: DUF4012 domain-containing protein [Patescibacteria group bacterium]|nr:DUF4012 domain-containing protein [Patescibacteria group bacterium]